MAKRPWHISGKLHITGNSRFIGEEPKPEGILSAKLLFSPVAHAQINKLDISPALAMKDITTVLTAKDIPGKNKLGHLFDDEPLLTVEEITYVGQPLAIVLSSYPNVAAEGTKQIILKYKELKPLLSIRDAEENKSWYVPERVFENGDLNKGFKDSAFILEGETETSTHEHFYFETQRCIAVPGEGEQMTVYSATQSTMEVQEAVAKVLGTAVHNVIVDVMRLGGAFGGKESRATIFACLTALAAKITGKPVELKLSRKEDFLYTGKRHPFWSRYKVGFDELGCINSYDVELVSNGGAYTDLSIAILQRAMFHAENAYYIPNVRIRGRACRTNLPPNTAFRGFGAPQGIYVIESVIERIAYTLKKDPMEIRRLNSYQSGQITPYGQEVQESDMVKLFDRLIEKSNYEQLKKETIDFNKKNDRKKRGLAVVPVKFGISFTSPVLNQGSALVWIYIDGTVSVTTGGVEMGQEVNTKVAAVVSRVLGISRDNIRVESSNTQRVGNASPTAASTGSDINGNAARIACEELLSRLLPLAAELLEAKNSVKPAPGSIVFEDDKVFDKKFPLFVLSFPELIQQAYDRRIALGAYGYYKTPGIWFDKDKNKGNPFYYYVYGCALVRVEIDLMTGENKLLEVYIIHQNGKSLHIDVDRGQTIGAFMQSYGWCTIEEMPWDDKGHYLASTVSTYKIPCIRDLPEKLEVELIESENEYASVLGSKAVGEPPYIYGEAAHFAIKNALQSMSEEEISLPFPATPEAVLMTIEKIKKKNPTKVKIAENLIKKTTKPKPKIKSIISGIEPEL
ncbi:MAG: molybdopterin-dependent oxidoreductase [Candidatus Cloacimonetes bacterium]|nr:molybdopterin-dependent oxidoreductase [Candidatus Cloacimonadota bacterium]